MSYHYYDRHTQQLVKCNIYGKTMFDLVSLESLVEFHIPQQVTYHHTWRMYDDHKKLQMLHAHPDSEMYETFDGALYNKQTHTLLYVPLGKETLHIPKQAKYIGYEAFKSDRLKTVSVDPENPYFQLVDGNLYSSTMSMLYFVPRDCPQLFVSSEVRYIDLTILARKFESVVVSNDNPVFKVRDGVLYDRNRVIYICPNVHSVYLHSDADVLSLCEMERISYLREIRISKDHPQFRAIDNVIYNKDGTNLVYIPTGIQTVHFPNQLTSLKRAQFKECADLKEIYIHQNTKFNARSFIGLNDKCRVFVHIDEKNIELPRGDAFSLSKCIEFLNGAGAEVKPRTELFYLDYYLLGINRSPEFCRVLQVSSWQIIKRVIEDNHISRIKELLLDGYLITGKNINKALKLAMQCGNTEIYNLLLSFKKTKT